MGSAIVFRYDILIYSKIQNNNASPELPLERFFLNYARNFYQLEDTEENLQKIVNHCEKFKRKEEKVYWGSVSLYKKVKKQLDSATLFREHDFYEFMELIYSLGMLKINFIIVYFGTNPVNRSKF